MSILGDAKRLLFSSRKRNLEKTRRQFEKIRSIIVTNENRQHGLFNAEWYEENNPDIASDSQNALQHYLNHGYKEGRNPGPNFDTRFYVTKYPDVAVSGLNPLLHYILYGKAEGRQCKGSASYDAAHHLGGARHTFVKELILAPGDDAALLVTHAPAGRLKPHILPYIEQLSRTSLSVLLVVNVDRPLELLDREIAAAAGVIVRDNAGYDFGAWAHALQLCPSLFGAGLLVMTNDSVIPTADVEVFGAMMAQVRECSADITALTASHEYGWHVQSYFLGLKPKALSSWGFQHFMRDLRRIDDKDEVIRTYEVPFARKMQAAGLTVQALYAGSFSANPTFFNWRELIEQGFPFIKLLMLRDKFGEVTDQVNMLKEVRREWPRVLRKKGFDIELVQATLRAAEISSVPAGLSTDLLVNAQRFDAITNDHPLRIAFFGPWNYESGLGAASREMLNALRHIDASVNAYPIMKPFSIHRAICPPIETIDFNGRPDIAIVHLNPDSWNFLTDEQRAIIGWAKQRIGYWVWETDKLSPAWQQELQSVDRIWAPSSYCADVFSIEVDVPVDVIPHPVRVPVRIASDRETTLRRFGIDPDLRVILYIFDSASYLVRKNPDGLIRAFAASGLAAQGWILLLKTKHLHDRPEAKALTKLANETPGVRILEVSLHSDEVTSLMAAADIYASPHCSEGFGLTVAEAMAVGKPVVATNYSGTQDFVDEKCGYPVSAKMWMLDQNYGHYPAGNRWAKVDENAFAAALVKAAKAIMSGDHSIGEAAKANIARRLSYEAVANAIKVSIARAVESSEVPRVKSPQQRKISYFPAPPEINPNFSTAKRFVDFTRSDGLVPVPLADDLSWDGSALPEGDPNEWILFAPRNARISPDARHFILSSSMSRPDVSLFYADDVAAGEDMLNRLNLKPDFNRALLIAQDYIGAPVAVRRKMLTDVGGIDTTRGTAVLYDLILRVADAGGAIARITEVLIGYEGKRPVADIVARRAALVACKGFDDIDLDEGEAPGLLLQRRRFAGKAAHPAVTIVIPTRRTRRPNSASTYIETLLASIAQETWPMDHITVIVGDDIVGRPDWADQPWPFKLKWIETPRMPGEQFNYSRKMNCLWREASDEQIIFLNDDVVPRTSHWLTALLSFGVDESVGGVGARLYYDDGSIQHVGMFPSFRTIVHAWLGWPVDAKTYNDWAVSQREWSVVTGAVFATRLSILKQTNGFDERFSLEFNDVDLCLRIRNLGYRIVYNPDAQFTHTEKASRGETVPPGLEVALFLSRWTRWLDNDPASHPSISTERSDMVAEPKSDAWYTKKS